MSAEGETVFTFNLPGGAACPSAPINYATDYRQSWQFSLHGIYAYCVYTLFSDNVHFSYFFLGFIGGKRFQQENLHNYIIFYQKLLGGPTDIMSSCPKVWGYIST